MDFGLDDTELAISELAEKMMRDFSTPERLQQLEDANSRLDLALWAELRGAGIATVGIDEERGGTGLGFAQTCLILEQLGRTVAAVPLLVHNIALQTLQQAGAEAELGRWLEGPAWLSATARIDAGNTLRHAGGRLSGAVSAVPYAKGASAVVLPARDGAAWGLYLVELDQPGAGVLAQVGTDQSPMGRVELDGASASKIGAADLIEWLRQRLIVGSCAVQTGVVDETIRMTAAYVAERQAFGVKIGSFQAVSQRMADTYIDAMALRLMSRDAASMLSSQAGAMADVLAAKMLAGDVGHRVLASCQHVHGGMGHDRTYPLWRYAVAAKQNELAVSCSAEATASLGALIASGREHCVL